MVGTRKLDQILEHAHRTRAKVVLVGDHHQLPEIEAGGAFAALIERLGTVTLQENRRQTNPTERAALGELRAGDIDDALSLLNATGNIHQHPTRTAATTQMVDAWLNDTLEGTDSIMLATTRTDVDDLNHHARTRLRTEGALDAPDISIGDRNFAVGDWVMTTRNDYQLGVLNGRTGIVTEIDPDGIWLVASVGEADRPVVFNRAQVEDGLLDHGYAITIHKAQGLTVDTAHVLADTTLYREAAYTALSRGRHANHLHLTPSDDNLDAHLPDTIDEHGLTALTSALAQSRQQRLASIDLRTLPYTPEPTIEQTRAAEVDTGIDLSW